ncbi:MAG: metallophosphoesterase [Acidobacteriota bacterium]
MSGVLSRLLTVGWVAWLSIAASFAQELNLPNLPNSLRIAVIGDSGTGGEAQIEIGQRMALFREKFPFELVLMLGDNIYGRDRPKDYVRKFERPYQSLLDAGVKFYAALGNHDRPRQVNYPLFNMKGRRYYSFSPGKDVRFFALDSTKMDSAQIEWLDGELAHTQESWKICFLHHPLYSSGRRHGSSIRLQRLLEPLLVKHGVQVVFAGHDHFYERIHPQKGISHFVSGGAAKLRKNNIRKSPLTAKGFDQDRHFMLLEVAPSALYFQAISRTGEKVDSGRIENTSSASGKATSPVVGVVCHPPLLTAWACQ